MSIIAAQSHDQVIAMSMTIKQKFITDIGFLLRKYKVFVAHIFKVPCITKNNFPDDGS